MARSSILPFFCFADMNSGDSREHCLPTRDVARKSLTSKIITTGIFLPVMFIQIIYVHTTVLVHHGALQTPKLVFEHCYLATRNTPR